MLMEQENISSLSVLLGNNFILASLPITLREEFKITFFQNSLNIR